MDNLINTTEINNKLIEEINYYASECQQKYKDYLEKKISESLDLLKTQIDSEIKSNICKKIGTGNLYCYDEYIGKSKEYRKLLENMVKNCEQHTANLKDKFMTNEKNQLIIWHKQITSGTHPINQTSNIFLSVNSNIINFSASFTQYSDYKYHVTMYENDFLLPNDYIKIFHTINLDHLSIGNINDMLVTIKNTLYDRKLIPLYAKDIVEENNKLKLLYDEYKEKNDNFLQIKNEFEVKYKPYLDLIEERKKLDAYKEKLIASHTKILLEKKRLDDERKILETRMNAINQLDLNDLSNL